MTSVLLRNTPDGPRLHITSNDKRMFELSSHMLKAGVPHETILESDNRTRLIVPVPRERKREETKGK